MPINYKVFSVKSKAFPFVSGFINAIGIQT